MEDADSREIKKTMLLRVMSEFNLKALSTLSSCDDWKKNAVTHKSVE